MKKTILNLSLAAFLVLAASVVLRILSPVNASAAGSNIAVVNMQKVISTSNQGKAAQSKLKTLVSKYNARLLAMRKKIAAVQADLKNNGSIMSANEKAKKTKEFEADISNFTSEEKHVQGIMSQKRFELLKGIVDKATTIINAIAKKDGYILVIDRPSVVYRAASIDITDEVLNQMNSK
ncbi:MAG: OmpH/Skp family outer membrane protein [bacterium]|jgi:Skp family chaperone for outer membrane proteins